MLTRRESLGLLLGLAVRALAQPPTFSTGVRAGQVFKDIEPELRNQYSIEYVSDRAGEGFRARKGYYAKT